jgi:Flp pilus assembly protein TadD
MLLRRRDQLQEEGGSLDAIDAQLAKGWGPAAAERFDLQILRRAQATDRRVAVVHNHLGWALIQLERFADAAGHFRESLKIWPGNPNAANNLRVLDRMVADRRAQDAPGATP